jgi:tetratricopeptide (TPR) repeat protein
MWRGTWLEAEAELTAATSELAASRPAMTADGLVRLAELRRRQGRLVEAAEMFEQAGSHSLALLGRAQLAFDRDDAAGAAELAARYMRRVPAQNRTARAEGLEVSCARWSPAGDLAAARTALAELSAIASLLATAPLRASASVAAGRLAFGEGQVEQAQRHFEDAVDLYSSVRRAVRAGPRAHRPGAHAGRASAPRGGGGRSRVRRGAAKGAARGVRSGASAVADGVVRAAGRFW